MSIPSPEEYLFDLETGPFIARQMSDPKLVYHNLSHAIDLAYIARNTLLRDEIAEHNYLCNFYYLCAFYHDIVYVPGASDNETRSANVFIAHRQYLKFLQDDDQDLIDLIVKTIHLTKDHFAPEAYGNIPQIDNFLDFDLMGLASDWDTYALNSQKIRLEFANVSIDDWLHGRRKFLERVLAAPRIFRRKPIVVENRARANILLELSAIIRQMNEETSNES